MKEGSRVSLGEMHFLLCLVCAFEPPVLLVKQLPKEAKDAIDAMEAITNEAFEGSTGFMASTT